VSSTATCPLCGSVEHGIHACPSAPKDLGRTEFSEQEREAAQHRIQDVQESFFLKARRLVGKLPFVPDAVAMYFCMVDPRTPFWVKATAAAALAYFILPTDFLADLLPLIGYTDDAVVLYTAIRKVHTHLTDDHFRKAHNWLGKPS
jgi:uncharacterized membrane protein YkvA (DUF1232 family)